MEGAASEVPPLPLLRQMQDVRRLFGGRKPEELNEDKRAVFDQDLVLIMKELHDEIDLAAS
jgi:hypothetical protein